MKVNDVTIKRFGYWIATVALFGAAGYSVAQVLQVLGLINFPIDAILIYGFSLCIAFPFTLSILALHYLVPSEKRFWTHASVLASVIYTTYVSLNYVVQLATVLPASLHGSLEPIRILDQTPHSLFWDVDGIGYIFMGIAAFFAAQVFEKSGMPGWTRRFLLAHALVTPLIAVVYFYPTFSTTLLIIGSPWIVTSTGSILLLALHFRRTG